MTLPEIIWFHTGQYLDHPSPSTKAILVALLRMSLLSR